MIPWPQVEPYDYCPCGSGKKLRHCCDRLVAQLGEAIQQHARGLRASAWQLVQEQEAQTGEHTLVLQARATMLAAEEQLAEALAAAEKAHALAPRSAHACLLCADLLARQQPPRPHQLLGLLIESARRIGMERQPDSGLVYLYLALFHNSRQALPATRAHLQAAQHLGVSEDLVHSPQFRAGFLAFFDGLLATLGQLDRQVPSDVPEVREIGSRLQEPGSSPYQRLEWSQQLAARLPHEPAVLWYLALAYADTGESASAFETLQEYMRIETDPAWLARAGALSEILLFDQRLAQRSTFAVPFREYAVRDMRALLVRLDATPLVYPLYAGEEQIIACWVERPLPEEVPVAYFELPAMLAWIVIEPGTITVYTRDSAVSAQMESEFSAHFGELMHLVDEGVRCEPGVWQALQVVKHLVPPVAPERASPLTQAAMTAGYEKWKLLPQPTLGGLSPEQAARHPQWRHVLEGLLDVYTQLFKEPRTSKPCLERLRSDLGLLDGQTDVRDWDKMTAEELAALVPESLSDGELEKAYTSALRQQATDTAEKLAAHWVARPPAKERPDRFAVYSYLAAGAQRRGALEQAQRYLEQGLQEDQVHNAGRRQADYCGRLARLWLASGDVARAVAEWTRLSKGDSPSLSLLGEAAEALLDSGHAAHALAFAERGRVVAERRGEKDHARYFAELVARSESVTGRST